MDVIRTISLGEKVDLVARLLFCVPLVFIRETIKTVTTALQRGLPVREYMVATVVRTLMTCFTERQMLYLHGTTSQTYQTWIKKEAKTRNLSPVEDTVVLADGTTMLHWIKKTKDKASKVVLLFHGGGYYIPIAPGHLNWCSSIINASGSTTKTMAAAVLEFMFEEAQTVAQLQSYFADQDSDVDLNVDTVQFVALIHLIDALQAIVEDDCIGEDDLLGWERVQQASHLLAHTEWLADGNLLTIQCLIVKGLYLLAAQEYHASYGIVGEASCRAPYFIQNCEIEVDLPACVDDKLIGGSEQLPDEDFDSSGVPYLRSNVKWARLGGETWDKIFCVSANRPVDEEVIVTFDAKIENLRRRIPKKLQWNKDSLKVMPAQANSTRLAPLAMMLHLRANQLRLQLRQPENRLSSEFRNEDIGTSLALATDTTTIVHDFCFAMHMTNRDRFSCATYMQDAVRALANIILDSIVDEHIFRDASASFNKALAVLQSLAPRFKAARRILEEFESLIRRVNDATAAHLPAQGRSNGHEGAGDLYAQVPDIDTDHLGAATALHGLRSGTSKELCGTSL
ncbi:alpha/beta-hydrolase, partial [Aureobasidium melanogenum]